MVPCELYTKIVSFPASQVWGIEHTSLIHAYLCVSTTPIIIAGGTWLLRRPISWGELGGTFLGAVGTVLLTLGPAAKGSQVCPSCTLVVQHLSTDRCICRSNPWRPPTTVYQASIARVTWDTAHADHTGRRSGHAVRGRDHHRIL